MKKAPGNHLSQAEVLSYQHRNSKITSAIRTHLINCDTCIGAVLSWNPPAQQSSEKQPS
jgi:hypothetical protein